MLPTPPIRLRPWSEVPQNERLLMQCILDKKKIKDVVDKTKIITHAPEDPVDKTIIIFREPEDK